MLKQAGVGVLAALAITCACAREAPRPVSASHPPDIFLTPQSQIIEAVVPPHATLDGLLRGYDFPAGLIQSVVRSAGSVFNLRQLRDKPAVPAGALRSTACCESSSTRSTPIASCGSSRPIATRPDVLDARSCLTRRRPPSSTIRGVIDADHPSLIAAMEASGETIQLAMALADIFGGQIDFESDLQPRRHASRCCSRSRRATGSSPATAPILGAPLQRRRPRSSGVPLDRSRDTARAAYYDENGRSLKRFFLRTPLKFEPRITSGFSLSRLHPVFRTYHAHLGIDYAAPTGAPVVAVAAGTVVSAGWAGGGGNQVRLRHASGYETYYLHLSAFGPGHSRRRARRSGTS